MTYPIPIEANIHIIAALAYNNKMIRDDNIVDRFKKRVGKDKEYNEFDFMRLPDSSKTLFIFQTTCEILRLTPKQLRGNDLHARMINARHFFAVCAAYKTSATLEQIGNCINRRHTSVMYYKRTFKKKLASKKFSKAWEEFKQKAPSFIIPVV